MGVGAGREATRGSHWEEETQPLTSRCCFPPREARSGASSEGFSEVVVSGEGGGKKGTSPTWARGRQPRCSAGRPLLGSSLCVIRSGLLVVTHSPSVPVHPSARWAR